MDKNKICDKAITEEFKMYEENGSITECNDIDDMINLAKFLLKHSCKKLRVVQIAERMNLKLKLYDIYISKDKKKLIQIDSYATHMNSMSKGFIVVYKNIERHNEFEIGSSPSDNGYGTKEEIESEYELFIHQEDLHNYEDWNEIFKKANLIKNELTNEEYDDFLKELCSNMKNE